jgi:hypothetical protein
LTTYLSILGAFIASASKTIASPGRRTKRLGTISTITSSGFEFLLGNSSFRFQSGSRTSGRLMSQTYTVTMTPTMNVGSYLKETISILCENSRLLRKLQHRGCAMPKSGNLHPFGKDWFQGIDQAGG